MSEPVVHGYIPVTFTKQELDFVEFVCFKIEDFFDRISLQTFKLRYPKKGWFGRITLFTKPWTDEDVDAWAEQQLGENYSYLSNMYYHYEFGSRREFYRSTHFDRLSTLRNMMLVSGTHSQVFISDQLAKSLASVRNQVRMLNKNWKPLNELLHCSGPMIAIPEGYKYFAQNVTMFDSFAVCLYGEKPEYDDDLCIFRKLDTDIMEPILSVSAVKPRPSGRGYKALLLI